MLELWPVLGISLGFLRRNAMQKAPSVISKIDHVLFDFARCINDLHSLKNELSFVDIDHAERCFTQLRDAIHEKQRQRISALYAVI